MQDQVDSRASFFFISIPPLYLYHHLHLQVLLPYDAVGSCYLGTIFSFALFELAANKALGEYVIP